MGGRAPKGPFKAVSSQKTAQGNIIGRLKCPARNCGGDALAKVDGMGWLQVTHSGCTTLTGRSYNAANEIIERIKEYPEPNKWATVKAPVEAEAALESLLEPSKPKQPSAPVFVGGVSNVPDAPDNTLPVPEGATRNEPIPSGPAAPVQETPVPEGATRRSNSFDESLAGKTLKEAAEISKELLKEMPKPMPVIKSKKTAKKRGVTLGSKRP